MFEDASPLDAKEMNFFDQAIYGNYLYCHGLLFFQVPTQPPVSQKIRFATWTCFPPSGSPAPCPSSTPAAVPWAAVSLSAWARL